MMKCRDFIFELFDIHWIDSGYHWWVSILEIQLTDWNGSLIHVEYDQGHWKFEFLYLRQLIYNLRDN